MDQEERDQRSSSNSETVYGSMSRSSSLSRKQKPKKVPQRGLGVAQLEKIRLEEQQKKETAAAIAMTSSSPSSVVSPTTIKSPFPSLPFQNYHHHSNHSSSSSSPSLPYPPDYPVSNSAFRPPPFVPNVDAIHGACSLPGTIPWQPAAPPGGHHHRLVKSHNSGEFGVEKESFAVDPRLAVGSNVNLAYGANPIWQHHPCMVQRPQQHQQPFSSLVNVSSATSSTLLNQMEPPSNQSFGSNYTPMWAEEEKTVRLKRPYPFSLDNPPSLPINYKIPTLAHPRSRSDALTSSGDGGRSNLESINQDIREGTQYSSSKSNSKPNGNGNGALNGDFLSLRPPDAEPPPCQGNPKDLFLQPAPGGSNQQQRYYFFLPPSQDQSSQDPTATKNLNGREEESVDAKTPNEKEEKSLDLNLKL